MGQQGLSRRVKRVAAQQQKREVVAQAQAGMGVDGIQKEAHGGVPMDTQRCYYG